MLFMHLSTYQYTHEHQQGANGVSLYIVTCLLWNSIATHSSLASCERMTIQSL